MMYYYLSLKFIVMSGTLIKEEEEEKVEQCCPQCAFTCKSTITSVCLFLFCRFFFPSLQESRLYNALVKYYLFYNNNCVIRINHTLSLHNNGVYSQNPILDMSHWHFILIALFGLSDLSSHQQIIGQLKKQAEQLDLC